MASHPIAADASGLFLSCMAKTPENDGHPTMALILSLAGNAYVNLMKTAEASSSGGHEGEL
jgi:hypothetical protein